MQLTTHLLRQETWWEGIKKPFPCLSEEAAPTWQEAGEAFPMTPSHRSFLLKIPFLHLEYGMWASHDCLFCAMTSLNKILCFWLVVGMRVRALHMLALSTPELYPQPSSIPSFLLLWPLFPCMLFVCVSCVVIHVTSRG